MSSSRLVHVVAVVLLAGVLAVAVPGVSSAVFTSSSTSTATVRAALDWTPPTVALADPGTHVRGTLPVVATADDRESGIARVTLELLPPGGSWTTLCAPTAAPYSCAWNTASRADGQYALRATARDGSGYQTVSAVARPVVDNTAPTVTMTDPGTPLTGTRTFAAGNVADAGSGVARVVLQYAVSGSGSFQELCTLTAAPWSCSRDTAALPDGRYDVRAVATDRAGNTTTSAVVANRVLDNSPALAGLDVQAPNGGRTAERLDSGDTLVYTFTRVVDPSSVLAGWTGAERAVSVRVGGSFLGGDTLDVVNVNLGTVDLKRNYVLTVVDRAIPATMTAETETIGGKTRTRIVVRFSDLSGVTTWSPTGSAAHMTWSPSGVVTDLLGNRSSTTTVTESGPLDKEF